MTNPYGYYSSGVPDAPTGWSLPIAHSIPHAIDPPPPLPSLTSSNYRPEQIPPRAPAPTTVPRSWWVAVAIALALSIIGAVHLDHLPVLAAFLTVGPMFVVGFGIAGGLVAVVQARHDPRTGPGAVNRWHEFQWGFMAMGPFFAGCIVIIAGLLNTVGVTL